MDKRKVLKGGTACCCGGTFLVWFVLSIVSLLSVAVHPLFCDSDASARDAAHEARPKVYGKDGSINWESVATGWNAACGAMPGNWSATERLYAADSGGLALVRNDSGFRRNAWSDLNFRVWKLVDVEKVDGYAFGERPRAIRSVARTFSVNLFWLPTATSEVCGYYALQYEVCAYFEHPSGRPPTSRLYKTTDSPLGELDPFVQEFVKARGGDAVSYNVVSDEYDDDGPGVGKAGFTSVEAEKCYVWSKAKHNYGLFPLLCVTTALVVFAGAAVAADRLRRRPAAKTVPAPE